MEKPNELTQKERSLIAVGASLAAGRQPCTGYHIRTARAAGACERSLALAIEAAVEGRESATRVMAGWARECQGDPPEVDAEFRATKRLLSELTSVATAVAVNSVPDLQKHLSAAQDAGASPNQIRFAIETANHIKWTAEEKIEAITNNLACAESTTAATRAGCCDSAAPAGQATCGTGSDCGCQ